MHTAVENVGLDLENPESSDDGMFSVSDYESDSGDDTAKSSSAPRQNIWPGGSGTRGSEPRSAVNGGETSAGDHSDPLCFACVTCASTFLTDITVHAVDQVVREREAWRIKEASRHQSQGTPRSFSKSSTNASPVKCFFHMESFEL